MKIPPTINEAALRQLIAAEADGPLVEEPWPCDVKAIHADLIELFNQRGLKNGYPVEPQFANINSQSARLEDLLWNDFDYLLTGAPVLQSLASQYVFAEIAAPEPGASSWLIDTGASPAHLICFKSPLICLINSAFSKIYVLNHTERNAWCLDEHKHLFAGDTYSDTNLLAGLFNDVEILFDKKRLSVPFSSPHMAIPYDYCQMAEGARRFILAHELGHTLFNDEQRPTHITDLIPADLQRWAGHKNFLEEYWCDAFAVQTILTIYDTPALDDSLRYELENTLVGILKFLTLMDLVDAALGQHLQLRRPHPPARFRREVVRSIIKSHRLYETTPNLKQVLQAKWRTLNTFRQFAGGANAPIFFRINSLWSYPDFLERLTPFGKTAYRALFDATVEEFRIFYDNDEQARLQDEGHF